MQMTLKNLLRDLLPIDDSLDKKITGLSCDSRNVKPGFLFFAVKGDHKDGKDFIMEAIQNGVTAIIVDEKCSLEIPGDIVLLEHAQIKEFISHLAARFYKYPSKDLQVIGVTGTNGKTTCCHLLANLLAKEELPCALMGTLGVGFPSKLEPSGLTTPDPITLQSLLYDFKRKGALAVAMEVSSHALSQGRVNAVEFTMGVFTNLTQDHLDYHVNMKAYATAKQLLFKQKGLRYALINLDDPFGHVILQELPKTATPFTYSLENRKADICAYHIETSVAGIKATIATPWGNGQCFSPLLGSYNLSNILVAIGVLGIMGIPIESILDHVKSITSIPGRMQSYRPDGKPTLVIDYAHTPDALKNVLTTLREHCKEKLWCVFGCGGDRDKTKRSIMGGIAEQYSDFVVVTNDNPRSEPPESIAEEILKGMKQPERVNLVLDRYKAIESCIAAAAPDDIVLIAGKGHEDYQIIGHEYLPFSDSEVVKQLLHSLNRGEK